MRVLITEGSGLTSRQVATRLSALGHQVGVVTSDRLCLARFTRTVRWLHDVPPYGEDPFGWLDATIAVHRSHRYDLLLPTQEQVAVLSRAASEVRDAGVRTVVPPFDSLVAVQDKVAARATLERLSIPQPRSTVLRSVGDLDRWSEFPVFFKTPIGTATSGVRRVGGRRDLALLVEDWSAQADPDTGVFDGGGVLAQVPVPGPLVMVQAVFDGGVLVAFHANERVREGARGGASHKRGLAVPEVRGWMASMGGALRWHGALSWDVILGPEGPVVIDVNPRLVEPMNAWRSGTDLVGAMVQLGTGVASGAALDLRGPPSSPPRLDVRTHQLLLAVLGAAQRGAGRRGVARELLDASTGRGSYRDSTEELTPWRGDLRGTVPLIAATVATLVRPAAWQRFSSGSIATYAMGPAAWRRIRAGRAAVAASD